MIDLAELHTITGADAVEARPDFTALHALGGAAPLAVVSPATPEAAAAALRWAAATGCRAVPRGQGSRLRRWQAPAGPWIALSTRRLDALVELNAENLTVTCGAGVRLDALAAALAAADLYCPPLAHLPAGTGPGDSLAHLPAGTGPGDSLVPPPAGTGPGDSLVPPPAGTGSGDSLVPPPAGTGPGDSLGGAVAARLSGPQRARHGPLRNWVLALQVATPGGELVELGAPTVKNVAGYDLVKLHIGARGSLGLITAVTLRLLKLPPESATLLAAFASPAAAIAALHALAAGPYAPVAAELLDPTSAAALAGTGSGGAGALAGTGGWPPVPAGGALALVELAGAQVAPWREAVATALRSAGGALHLDAAGASGTLAGDPRPGAWDDYARLPLSLQDGWPVRLQAAVPPAAAPALWAAATAAGARILLCPAAGTAHLFLKAADLPERLPALRRAVEQAGGYVEPVAGPPALAQVLPPAPPSALDAAIRRRLDPAGVMG